MAAKKWSDELYATIYELVKGGATRAATCQALGISVKTLEDWCEAKPALRATIARAREVRKAQPGSTPDLGKFVEYCYKRLPDHLRPLWDDLMAADSDPNPERAIERLLASQGKRARQMLTVHALCTVANWNAAEACRRTGVTQPTWRRWVSEDPDFQELLLNVREFKKDYLEGAFFNLVAAGDTAAILFGMKTLNADRGYNPRVTVQHQHEGSVLHTHVELDKLPVDIDTKRKLLAAIREQRAALPDGGPPKALRPAAPPELLLDDED